MICKIRLRVAVIQAPDVPQVAVRMQFSSFLVDRHPPRTLHFATRHSSSESARSIGACAKLSVKKHQKQHAQSQQGLLILMNVSRSLTDCHQFRSSHLARRADRLGSSRGDDPVRRSAGL